MRFSVKQSGVSLVELMIAMVMGLIIIGGVTVIFVNAAASFNVKRDLDRSQENLRFVANYLLHEMRQATRIYQEEIDRAWPAISVASNGDGGQAVTIRYPVPVIGHAVHCDGTKVSAAGGALEKRFSVSEDGMLLCESWVRSGETLGPVVAETVASGLLGLRVVEWIESPVRPFPYALCTYSDLDARKGGVEPAGCPNLGDYKNGLGLVGIRVGMEFEDVGGARFGIVTTVALRNAVLEWFTRPERWEQIEGEE